MSVLIGSGSKTFLLTITRAAVSHDPNGVGDQNRVLH